MATLYITVGDDDNKEFKKDIQVEVSGTTYLLIKDRCRTADHDDYSRAWDEMCNAISSQYPDLPEYWYVYSIER